MPVYKYRRVEDMPEAWEYFGNRNRAGRLRAVLRFARLAGNLQIPRGVAKFRTIEEHSADRERYEQERVDRVRALRERKQ
jgi:hypothetical protein